MGNGIWGSRIFGLWEFGGQSVRIIMDLGVRMKIGWGVNDQCLVVFGFRLMKNGVYLKGRLFLFSRLRLGELREFGTCGGKDFGQTWFWDRDSDCVRSVGVTWDLLDASCYFCQIAPRWRSKWWVFFFLKKIMYQFFRFKPFNR